MTNAHKEINQELQILKQKVEDFEKKYLWAGDVALMNTILNLLKVNEITITTRDIERYRNKPYVAEYNLEHGAIHIEQYNKFLKNQ